MRLFIGHGMNSRGAKNMNKVFHNKIVLLKTIFWSIMMAGLTNKALALQGEGSATIENPLGNTGTFAELISKIASIVLKIGFPIAVLFIIYSGFLFVTARGSEDKIKTAKQTFTWAIIGTAVLLGAEVLALAIQATIESFK